MEEGRKQEAYMGLDAQLKLVLFHILNTDLLYFTILKVILSILAR